MQPSIQQRTLLPQFGKNPETIYKLVQQIGEGSYGTVYKSINLVNDQLFAVKMLKTSVDEKDTAAQLSELLMLKPIYQNMTFIVRLHEVYLDQNKQIWLILEYCSMGSVSDIIKITGIYFSEDEISGIVCNILKALEYCHANNLMHRDIKPANILFTNEGEAKLSDFGIASTKIKSNSFMGTPHYMSPEQLNNGSYTNAVDIWALGICIIEMAEGKPPYHQYTGTQAINQIKQNPPSQFQDANFFSPKINDFLTHCLQVEPEERWTAKKLLEHPFIKDKVEHSKLIKQHMCDVRKHKILQYKKENLNQQQQESHLLIASNQGFSQLLQDTKTYIVHSPPQKEIIPSDFADNYEKAKQFIKQIPDINSFELFSNKQEGFYNYHFLEKQNPPPDQGNAQQSRQPKLRKKTRYESQSLNIQNNVQVNIVGGSQSTHKSDPTSNVTINSTININLSTPQNITTKSQNHNLKEPLKQLISAKQPVKSFEQQQTNNQFSSNINESEQSPVRINKQIKNKEQQALLQRPHNQLEQCEFSTPLRNKGNKPAEACFKQQLQVEKHQALTQEEKYLERMIQFNKIKLKYHENQEQHLLNEDSNRIQQQSIQQQQQLQQATEGLKNQVNKQQSSPLKKMENSIDDSLQSEQFIQEIKGEKNQIKNSEFRVKHKDSGSLIRNQQQQQNLHKAHSNQAPCQNNVLPIVQKPLIVQQIQPFQPWQLQQMQQQLQQQPNSLLQQNCYQQQSQLQQQQQSFSIAQNYQFPQSLEISPGSSSTKETSSPGSRQQYLFDYTHRIQLNQQHDTQENNKESYLNLSQTVQNMNDCQLNLQYTGQSVPLIVHSPDSKKQGGSSRKGSSEQNYSSPRKTCTTQNDLSSVRSGSHVKKKIFEQYDGVNPLNQTMMDWKEAVGYSSLQQPRKTSDQLGYKQQGFGNPQLRKRFSDFNYVQQHQHQQPQFSQILEQQQTQQQVLQKQLQQQPFPQQQTNFFNFPNTILPQDLRQLNKH